MFKPIRSHRFARLIFWSCALGFAQVLRRFLQRGTSMRALWSERQNCSHNVSQTFKRSKRFSRCTRRVVLCERTCFCLLSAFNKRSLLRTLLRNPCLYWKPLQPPSKKHILVENLLRTLLRVACCCMTPLVCILFSDVTKKCHCGVSRKVSQKWLGKSKRGLTIGGLGPNFERKPGGNPSWENEPFQGNLGALGLFEPFRGRSEPIPPHPLPQPRAEIAPKGPFLAQLVPFGPSPRLLSPPFGFPPNDPQTDVFRPSDRKVSFESLFGSKSGFWDHF